MYQQREQLLEKYELTVKEVSKGRGTVIADTDQGRVVLQEYHGSGERVGALAQALAYLRDWDGRTEQLLSLIHISIAVPSRPEVSWRIIWSRMP